MKTCLILRYIHSTLLQFVKLITRPIMKAIELKPLKEYLCELRLACGEEPFSTTH